jgi:hypothetical protein
MAKEARLNISLNIRKVFNGVTVLDYRSTPTSFNADVDGTKGPTPSAIRVSTAGTDVSLAEITGIGDTPGLCWLSNLDTTTDDDTHYVEYGIYDPLTFTFYPLGELLPGECYAFRLSRFIESELGTGTGTGTISSDVPRLRFKAHGAAVDVRVDAFSK